MKNKFLKLLIFISLPLIFSGCGNLINQSTYNDNKIIANESEKGSSKFSTTSPIVDGKIHSKIGKLDGFREIMVANVNKDTNITLHIKMTADSGKGKLVLVKPNSEVELLAEVISEENKNFEDDVTVTCAPGSNKIKIVGENYGGNFEIYQPNDILFKSKTDAKLIKDKNNDDMDNMFDENFPFKTNTH